MAKRMNAQEAAEIDILIAQKNKISAHIANMLFVSKTPRFWKASSKSELTIGTNEQLPYSLNKIKNE